MDANYESDGVGRALLRTAIRYLEETEMPNMRDSIRRGDRSENELRIALAIINHGNFRTAMEQVYLPDGASVIYTDGSDGIEYRKDMWFECPLPHGKNCSLAIFRIAGGSAIADDDGPESFSTRNGRDTSYESIQTPA